MKHIHADSMLEYAKDAQTTNEPWLQWEYCRNNIWYDLNTHPQWAKDIQYKKKVVSDDLHLHLHLFLKEVPLQVSTSMQADLYKVLSKQEPFYEDYGQFCGGYQTKKFRVIDIIYTVKLDPDAELLDITYTK